MTSRFVTCSALVVLALSAGARPTAAQTSLSWGEHISRYGSGYVGNAPNTIPATSYYRAPAIPAYAQPATSYYAPAVVAPTAVAPANYYSPGVSYRVGTPNSAAYTSAYSPIVTPSTPYAANWQYPPQTVMPTVANYAPVPPAYTTNYARTPVTTYRPVTVLSPTGVPQTVLQPCSGYECQAQRTYQGCFGWLFHRNPTPATIAAPGTVAGYPCASGACGQPAPVSVPYYTPGPAPIGSGGASAPANVAPSLGPAPTSSTIIPNSSINTVPPSQLNSSGGQRVDYPPADAYCPPATDSFRPNVSPAPMSPAPMTPVVPLSPLSPSQNGSAPADVIPSLNAPSNAPIGSGVLPQGSAPAEDGARSQFRPSFNVETQQRPPIRRDNNITPIPDPEVGTGTKAKMNKAPQLLAPARDRTAQATKAEVRQTSLEQPAPAPKAVPAPKKVLGDEVWRSAK